MIEQIIKTIECKAIHWFDQVSADERTGITEEDQPVFSIGFASGFVEAMRTIERMKKESEKERGGA